MLPSCGKLNITEKLAEAIRFSSHVPSARRAISVSIFFEYLRFLRSQKKLWMIPLVLILLALGSLAALGHVAAVLPFIYALF